MACTINIGIARLCKTSSSKFHSRFKTLFLSCPPGHAIGVGRFLHPGSLIGGGIFCNCHPRLSFVLAYPLSPASWTCSLMGAAFSVRNLTSELLLGPCLCLALPCANLSEASFHVVSAAPLSGLVQTPYRAELFAVYAALCFADHAGSECRIWSDCQGVVTRFRLLTMGCQSLDQLSAC